MAAGSGPHDPSARASEVILNASQSVHTELLLQRTWRALEEKSKKIEGEAGDARAGSGSGSVVAVAASAAIILERPSYKP